VKTEGRKQFLASQEATLVILDLDSLFQKTPIITPKKQTVQPGDTFEDVAF
jgi:hypothetical protein